MTTENVSNYLSAVYRGKNNLWRYIVSILIMLVCYTVLGAYCFLVVLYSGLGTKLTQFANGKLFNDDLQISVLLNLSAPLLGLGLVFAVKVLHQRSLLSLITPFDRLNFRRIGQAIFIWLILSSIAVGFQYILFPNKFSIVFDLDRWLVAWPAVLIIGALQITIGELVFRAYVLQSASLLTKNKLVLCVTAGFVAWIANAVFQSLVVLAFTQKDIVGIAINSFANSAAYFAIGAFLAAITLRSGSLELAIGVGIATQIFSILLFSQYGSQSSSHAIVTQSHPDTLINSILSPIEALIFLGLVYKFWDFTPKSQSGSFEVGNKNGIAD